MENEIRNMGETKIEKAKIFLKKISFNDGTQIELKENSIIVFTGANNSGKTQVLKDIEHYLDCSNQLDGVVIKDVECEYYGDIMESSFFNEHFFVNESGNYQMKEQPNSYAKSILTQWWNDRVLEGGLYLLFVKRLDTGSRLSLSNPLIRNSQCDGKPIYKLFNKGSLEQKISDYFREAFGVDLVVNRNEVQTISLHIGKSPDKKAFTIDEEDKYYEQVNALPKLHDQGDGMRSFASILLDTFTSDYSITLIDEPEAFLHPPQARILGKILVKNNSDNRQLLISTHSEDFLQGLLDVNEDNVIIIRINREENINRMSILQNEEIKKLWGNPLLRYSNILSGLFHEKVVVCESDYDCLFYQAVINAIYETRGEFASDILFTHCGGKTRIKDIVNALKAVDVTVLAICDFDLLNSSQNFKLIAAAFGLDWQRDLQADMKIIYDYMNKKSSKGVDAWKEIKKIGKTGFNDDAYSAYKNVEKICKAVGLFIVPVGEMECFDKNVNKEKKDWVYHILENFDLATETDLKEAREFVQEVVDFKKVIKE